MLDSFCPSFVFPDRICDTEENEEPDIEDGALVVSNEKYRRADCRSEKRVADPPQDSHAPQRQKKRECVEQEENEESGSCADEILCNVGR